MTLPAAYATMSMGDINVELGRSRTSYISLNSAEAGAYAEINLNSSSRPSPSDPAAISEWYSYNHNAAPPVSYNYYGTYFTDPCAPQVDIYRRSSDNYFFWYDGSTYYPIGSSYYYTYEYYDYYEMWYVYTIWFIGGTSIYPAGSTQSWCAPY